MKEKDRSFLSAQTASMYLSSSDAFKGNKDRSFRFAQTASTYLN